MHLKIVRTPADSNSISAVSLPRMICRFTGSFTIIHMIFILFLSCLISFRRCVPVRGRPQERIHQQPNEGTKRMACTNVRTHTRRVDIAIAVEYSFVDGSITRNSLAHRSRRCHAVAPLSRAFLSFRRKPALWHIHQPPGTATCITNSLHSRHEARPGCFSTRRWGRAFSARQEAERMRGLRVTGSHPVACRDPRRKCD